MREESILFNTKSRHSTTELHSALPFVCVRTIIDNLPPSDTKDPISVAIA